MISDLLNNNLSVSLFLAIVCGLFVSIGVHEFAHAVTAYILGDVTPYNQGRITLNPLKHMDPLGSLFLVLVGFGWGRPVNIDSTNFKHPKLYTALTSIAGAFVQCLACICVFFNFYSFLFFN